MVTGEASFFLRRRSAFASAFASFFGGVFFEFGLGFEGECADFGLEGLFGIVFVV